MWEDRKYYDIRTNSYTLDRPWYGDLADHPDLPNWAPAYEWALPSLARRTEAVTIVSGYYFARDAAGGWHVVPDGDVDRVQFGEVAEFAQAFRAATAHV
jgi:hypothetical protein